MSNVSKDIQWLKQYCPNTFEINVSPLRLLETTVYLAGPIDRCPNLGVEWRKRFQTKLEDKYKCRVYNPMDKPTSLGDETPEGREKRRQLKRAGLYDEFASEIENVVHIDLRMIDKSDFIILYIDTDIHMCGTYWEAVVSAWERKPIIIWCEQGKIGIPDWLFGVLPHKLFFSTEDEVFNYLDHIHNEKEIDDARRWLFFQK